MKKNLFAVLFLATFLISCSYTQYLWHVSSHQLALLRQRTSLEKALKRTDLTEDQKRKLKLVSEIKVFVREELGWDTDEDIYSSYVHLDRPYVSWLLRVSPAYQLKAYEWYFPVVGAVPYKGFFEKEKALESARDFNKRGYDTYVRGVTAYSTLRWFEDPLLSSMLSYRESDFTVMIFHELAHTVLFFKNHINFNERFAEFVGRKSALLFYKKKEQALSVTERMKREWADELVFSSFMSEEYNKLKKWYEDNKGKVSKELKQKRLSEIQSRFKSEIRPKLRTRFYDYFARIELNNARLLSYRSYNYNMVEFEKLFSSPLIGGDLKAFMDYCAKFKKAKNPEQALVQALAKTQAPAPASASASASASAPAPEGTSKNP